MDRIFFIIVFVFSFPGIYSYSVQLHTQSYPTNYFPSTLKFKRNYVSLKSTSSDNKDDSIQPIQQPTAASNEKSSSPVNALSSTSDKELRNEKSRQNGLWTALRLGPPLLFKFAIVLVIKFVTDLIIFPSLFVYGIFRGALKKVAQLFKFNQGDSNQDIAMTKGIKTNFEEPIIINGDSI